MECADVAASGKLLEGCPVQGCHTSFGMRFTEWKCLNSRSGKRRKEGLLGRSSSVGSHSSDVHGVKTDESAVVYRGVWDRMGRRRHVCEGMRGEGAFRVSYSIFRGRRDHAGAGAASGNVREAFGKLLWLFFCQATCLFHVVPCASTLSSNTDRHARTFNIYGAALTAVVLEAIVTGV